MYNGTIQKKVALRTIKITKTVVTADYDYMVRRVYKKVETITPDPEGGNGIRTAYTYTPYGEVTSRGNVTQPIQWSSEYNDTKLGMGYDIQPAGW